jgi:hypothetical protein
MAKETKIDMHSEKRVESFKLWSEVKAKEDSKYMMK